MGNDGMLTPEEYDLFGQINSTFENLFIDLGIYPPPPKIEPSVDEQVEQLEFEIDELLHESAKLEDSFIDLTKEHVALKKDRLELIEELAYLEDSLRSEKIKNEKLQKKTTGVSYGTAIESVKKALDEAGAPTTAWVHGVQITLSVEGRVRRLATLKKDWEKYSGEIDSYLTGEINKLKKRVSNQASSIHTLYDQKDKLELELAQSRKDTQQARKSAEKYYNELYDLRVPF